MAALHNRAFMWHLPLKRLSLGLNDLLRGITRKAWRMLGVSRLGRLWEVACGNVCGRLVLKTSPVEVGELFPVVLFIFLGVVVV